MTSTKEPIQTDDPEILATVGEEDVDLPDPEGLRFRAPDGTEATVEVGVDLYEPDGTLVGTVTRIMNHDTSPTGHESDWNYTVYIDYATSEGMGGVPLGEIAKQWAEGTLASLRDNLAKRGHRKPLLLALKGRDEDHYGVRHVAQEVRGGAVDGGVYEQVEDFLGDVRFGPEDGLREAYAEGEDWDALEAEYGALADLYLGEADEQ